MQRAISRRAKIVTGVVDTSTISDHVCVQNYDGSSGAVESDGLLLILKQLYVKYKDSVYVEIVVTDDDTKIKKYVSYPKYAARGWKNTGGVLPSFIPEPKWLADPTHRAKCVAGVFFEMTKGAASDTRATKLDALRMKKYYSYFIKRIDHNPSNGWKLTPWHRLIICLVITNCFLLCGAM